MRILLIEDDTVLGAAVRDQIAGDGHSADWVMRLDAAEDALAGAAFDLILLDLMLPDGRGIPFLKTLRSRGNATKYVATTDDHADLHPQIDNAFDFADDISNGLVINAISIIPHQCFTGQFQ